MFLKGQMKYFSDRGHTVHLISSPGHELKDLEESDSLQSHPIKIAREMSPLQDIISLIKVLFAFWKIRPDVINVGTPKGALLGIVAGYIFKVNTRVYTVHGLRFETTHGLKKSILKSIEKCICFMAHTVVCVSPSLRDTMIKEGLAPSKKLHVINSGTCNGISDSVVFSDMKLRDALSEKLGIAKNDFVVGFAGRFVRDKGVTDLYEAFKRLKSSNERCKLLLVGHFESGDPLPNEVVKELNNDPDVIFPGFVESVSVYYSLMDVFVLPSYREGIGLTTLEASINGVPVVTTRVTGAVDSLVEGETGLLVTAGDTEGLFSTLSYLYSNPNERKKLGKNGSAWVLKNFDQERYWESLYSLIMEQYDCDE